MKIVEIIKPLPLQGGYRGNHASPTMTPKFVQWFGKSRVVNSDGSPRVVYHGTASDFATFDSTHGGTTTATSDAGLGFWFSDSPVRANRAAQDAAWAVHDDELTGQNIMPVYLRIERPKIYRGMLPDLEKSAEQIKLARAAGHDGLIWIGGERNDWGFPIGTTYLVFSPNQIKSIHNDQPTNSDNMLESFELEKWGGAPDTAPPSRQENG